MVKSKSGFTIVELLIVIVVIAILAAISIVAYNGIQERARFASIRSDLATLNKAIQMYYADNGVYPLSNGWIGWDQAMGDNFVPGLVPKYLSSTPQLPAVNVSTDTYIYRSATQTDGSNYKLIRYKGGATLSSTELSAFADLRTTDCPGNYNNDRYGYWSSDVSKCW